MDRRRLIEILKEIKALKPRAPQPETIDGNVTSDERLVSIISRNLSGLSHIPAAMRAEMIELVYKNLGQDRQLSRRLKKVSDEADKVLLELDVVRERTPHRGHWLVSGSRWQKRFYPHGCVRCELEQFLDGECRLH